MIIIAGALRVDPGERANYLEVVAQATRLAREQPGCLDFTQSPDPIEPDRINIYERWRSDDDLAAFRALPGDDETPAIISGDVHRYRISSVEAP